MSVFEWLLELGPKKAVLLINAIAAVILIIALWIVRWVTLNR